MNELAAHIRQAPHWEFFFHPLAEPSRSLRLDRLVELVRDKAVRLRGWHYPHIELNNIKREVDRIDGVSFQELIEYWEYYRTGQFVSVFSLIEDNLGQGRQDVFYVDTSLLRITECLKFAADVSGEPVYEKGLHIELRVTGCLGRSLALTTPRPFNVLSRFFRTCQTDQPIKWRLDMSPSELKARSGEFALSAAQSIMEVFDDITSLSQYLAAEQAKFLRGDLRF